MNIEDIQTICKKLKAVTEDVKWGNDLVFSVGSKMFCAIGLEQSPATASFKVKEEEFEEMCSREGFKPAPYTAKYKWVWMDNIDRLNKKEWEQYILQSYDLVKAKLPLKLKKQLNLL
jgi:predicted DNA-binding protein (MmcQ/YjbR family)